MLDEGVDMTKRPGDALAITALVIYLVGGASAFFGIGMAAFMKGRDFMGLGDGRSIGWLFLCAGVSLSLLGVMFMRLVRNRNGL
jgi:hypothetical protein